MSYPDIEGAHRTREQALRHILSELIAGRLGANLHAACAYEAVTKGVVRHCGVGCLFNEAQIKSLKARGLNEEPIDIVRDHIGKKNLETVTGLDMDELEYIQDVHDNNYRTIQNSPKNSSFYHYLTEELEQIRS